MLHGPRDRFLRAVSRRRTFRLHRRVERMQHVTRMQLQVVETGGLRCQQRMRRCDTRVAQRHGEQPHGAGRIAPRDHHVSDVRVDDRELDAGNHDAFLGHRAGDANGPRQPKRQPGEILIRNRDDGLLIVDEDVTLRVPSSSETRTRVRPSRPPRPQTGGSRRIALAEDADHVCGPCANGAALRQTTRNATSLLRIL